MSKDKNSFPLQMYHSGKTDSPNFSLCFDEFSWESEDKAKVGSIIFGDYGSHSLSFPEVLNNENPKSNTEFSSLLIANKIFLKGTRHNETDNCTEDREIIEIQIDSNVTDDDRRQIKFDTEVTNIQLNSELQVPFFKAWKDLTGKDFITHIALENAELAKLPTIVLYLKVRNQFRYYLVCL